MARKIKLTERNLQQIVNRVIKESQLLNENLIEIECECGGDCMCYGNYDGSAADCTCCGTAGDDGCGGSDMVDNGGKTKYNPMSGGMSTGGGRGKEMMMKGMMGENRRLKLENRRLRNSRR